MEEVKKPEAVASAAVHQIDERDEIVLRLEKVLEAARAGEFVSMAVAAMGKDGSLTGSWYLGRRASHFTLVGGVENLKARIIRTLAQE